MLILWWQSVTVTPPAEPPPEPDQGGPGVFHRPDYDYGAPVAKRAKRQALRNARAKDEGPPLQAKLARGVIRVPSGQIVDIDQLSDMALGDDDLALLLILESDRLI